MASISRPSLFFARTAFLVFAALGANALAFNADAPSDDPGEAWGMLLAQSATAPAESDATVAPQAEPAPVRRPRARRAPSADIDWSARRERFAQMQETGFNLMMGGVACGVGGVALMVYGINQMESSHNSDPYGNDTGSPDGILPFFIGYISVGAGFPALMTTGIILNRIGNHKRQQAEAMLGTDAGARLDVGPNSLKLSYSF